MSFSTVLRRSFPSRSVRPWLLVAALLGVAAAGPSPAWQRHSPLPDPRTEVAAASPAARSSSRAGSSRAAPTRHGSTRTRSRATAGDGCPTCRSRSTTRPRPPRTAASTSSAATAATGSRSHRVRLRARALAPAPAPSGRPGRRRRCDRRREALRGRRHRRTAVAGAGRVRPDARGAELGAVPGRPRASTSPRRLRAAASTRSRGRSAGIDTNVDTFEVYDAAARRWRRLRRLREPGAAPAPPRSAGGSSRSAASGRRARSRASRFAGPVLHFA